MYISSQTLILVILIIHFYLSIEPDKTNKKIVNFFLEGEKQKVCFHLEKKVEESKLREEKRSKIFRRRMKLCDKQISIHEISFG